MKRILVLILLCMTFSHLTIDVAEAGVLRGKVRSRFRPRTTPSTRAAKLTKLNIEADNKIGTLKDDFKIYKMYAKYHIRLAKWETNRIKAEEKAKRKEEREKIKEKHEEEKKMRQFAKLNEKHQRKKAYQLSEENRSGGEHEAVEEDDSKITQSAKGGAVVDQTERPKKRQSFWTRFWNALTGRSGKETAEQKAETKASGSETRGMLKRSPAAAPTGAAKKPAAESAKSTEGAEAPAATQKPQAAPETSIHDRLFAPRT